MPAIYERECNKCDFTLPRGWGGCMYVVDGGGNRVVCRHPLERSTVELVLKKSNPEIVPHWKSYYWITFGFRNVFEVAWAKFRGQPEPINIRKMVEERTGFESYCVCQSCLQQFKIDLERDQRICPQCESVNVSNISEMVGRVCPSCGEGRITENRVGVS